MDYHFILSVFHIIFVVPLLLYIGFFRSSIPIWAFNSILVLGLVILAYHGFKLFLRLSHRSNYSWVNMLHIFTIAPLLIYIGYNKKDTPRFAYELSIMLAFAAGGYHIYSIVNHLDIDSKK
jgi:hypothetical protein